MLASFGLHNKQRTNGADFDAIAKVKGGGAKRQPILGRNSSIAQNTATAGAQDATRMYQAGERLLQSERNIPKAHAPCSGKEVF